MSPVMSSHPSSVRWTGIESAAMYSTTMVRQARAYPDATFVEMYAPTGNGVIRNCRVQPTARSSAMMPPPAETAFIVPHATIPVR